MLKVVLCSPCPPANWQGKASTMIPFLSLSLYPLSILPALAFYSCTVSAQPLLPNHDMVWYGMAWHLAFGRAWHDMTIVQPLSNPCQTIVFQVSEHTSLP